jgi:phosphoglycolate phosphatase
MTEAADREARERLRPAAAIAFDLDGTLVDSRLDIVSACNHVLAQAGRAPLDADVVAGYVGDGVRALVARAFALPPEDPALDAPVADFVAYYAAHPADHTTWMPGALDALDALADRPLALVTNKARAVTMRVLDALGAGGGAGGSAGGGAGARFRFVYAGGDGPLKPHAAPIQACARALGVDPAALWVVGDSPQDLGAARAAGSIAIAVCGGFVDESRLRAAGPDALLASIADLPELVRRAG